MSTLRIGLCFSALNTISLPIVYLAPTTASFVPPQSCCCFCLRDLIQAILRIVRTRKGDATMRIGELVYAIYRERKITLRLTNG